ncbi:MAG TPA: glycosyltransferase family 2 protein [Terriglobales bacterium]
MSLDTHEEVTLDLSVVILSAGVDVSMLLRCLESVLRACDPLDGKSEVILIANAAEHIAPVVAERFPSVTVIRFAERVGFCRANNAGFLVSRGKTIVQLNDDTEVADDAFQLLSRFLEQHPEVGAVGPRLETPDGALQVGYYARRLPTVLDVGFHLFGVNALWRGNPILRRYNLVDDADCSRPVQQPAGAALTYRREALIQIGLLDEQYTYAYDDVDVSRRLLASKWQIYYLREARVLHHGGVSLRKGAARLSYDTIHGMLLYFRKHGSFAEYASVRLMLLVSMLLRIPFECLLNLTAPGDIGAIIRNYGRGLIRTLNTSGAAFKRTSTHPIQVSATFTETHLG